MSKKRSLRSAVATKRTVASGLGVLLVLQVIVGSQVWVKAQGTGLLGATVDLPSTGWQANVVLSAVLLVQASAVVVLLSARKTGRLVALFVLSVSALVALWSAINIAQDPVRIAREAALERTGVTTLVGEPSVSVWVWIAGLCAALLMTFLGLVWRTARQWESGASRYEVRTGHAIATRLSAGQTVGQTAASGKENDKDALIDLWDALSQGTDQYEQTSLGPENRDNL